MDYKKILISVIVVLLVVVSGYAYYYRKQYMQIKSNPQKVAQDEVNALVARVKLIMLLPEGETPTLATVADPAKLKDQAFFANAKIGDKVLLYTNSRKAILYDPINNKIVEVAPISIGNPPAAQTAPATAAEPVAEPEKNK